MSGGDRLVAAADLLRALGVWALGAIVFFWEPVSSGFDQISGDQGDTRLIVALHEHWLQVLAGDASWLNPGFFHPVRGVLGYSDTFLLDLVFYGPLRLVGLDRWMALQGTLVLLSLVGFLATFAILRGLLRLDRLSASALAAAFAFANSLAVAADHPQLAAVHWLPLVVLLAARSARASETRRQIGYGAAAGSLLGLVLYSTYYIGWLALFTAAIFAVVLTGIRARDRALGDLVRLVRSRAAALGAGAVGFTVSIVPVVLTYVPVLRTAASRTYGEVMTFAPRPLDMVNLGAGNHLWASTTQRLLGSQPARLVNGEVSLAVTPILSALVLLTGGLLLVRRHRGQRSLATAVLLAMVVTIVVITVLPVNWGPWSFWVVPWNVVPGAVGIRAAGRLQLLTSLVSCLAVGGGIQALREGATSGSRRGRILAVVVPLVLLAVLAEQHNVRDFSRLDRSGELTGARRTPPPPETCRALFVLPAGDRPAFAIATDAMLLAVDTGLPTLNGYSGTTPKDYLLDPTSPDYLDRVGEWAAQRGVSEGLCSFDRTTHAWSTQPFDPPSPDEP